MTQPTHSVRFHRILRAPVERVYQAFLDADALCRWLPPYGFLGKIDSIDPREGGGYHMTFTGFSTGESHSFASRYVELVPNQKLVQVDRFDDPGLPGDMTKTIIFRSLPGVTELEILQEGIPAVIPSEMCCLGWQESLLQLANLVEPDFNAAG